MDIEPGILSFFKRDVLRHIVHLKMLTAYPGDIQSWHVADGPSEGVLLLLETQASPFDAKTYPTTRYVALPTATDERAAAALLEHIPTDCDLVFKLIDEPTKAATSSRYSLERKTAFISFTSPASYPSLRATPESGAGIEIHLSTHLDNRCLPLYAANGYSAGEMNDYLDRGAISFTMYEQNTPVATCFCFPNFEPVWEVAGVHTIASHRRRGLARRVVEAALTTLLERRYIPRYQVHEDNLPSIRLAEAVGLVKFLTTEHFLLCQKD